MKKSILVLSSIMMILMFLGTGLSVHAQTVTGFSTGAATSAGLSTSADANSVIQKVANYIAVLLAGLFVLMVLIGAVMYMVYPDAERKQKGMALIQGAVIGAIVALLAYVLWQLIDAVI